MKKIISILLAAVMLMLCIPFSSFAVSGSGYGWQWNDSVSYGYIKNYGSNSGTDTVIEFDASIVRGAEGAQFLLTTTGSASSIEVNPGADSVSIGTLATGSLGWGELSGSNWHHLAFKFQNGNVTVSIDNKVCATASGVSCRSGDVIISSRWGILTIDNFKISNNAGSQIMFCDFEDASQAQSYFGEGLGERVEIDSIPEPITTDIGWVARINGYGVLAKNVDKCDDYDVLNCGTVEFDMWMLPGTSGTAKCEFFESWEGQVRINILSNAVGYFYTPTEEERLTRFDWGPLSLTNKRHIRYDHTDENIKLYVDGNLVYTIPYGCTPAMKGLVVYMSEGFALIDNLVFTDTAGTVHGSFDMDTQWPDNDDANRVYVGDCENHGHTPASASIRKLDPTCTEKGYNVRYCLACSKEAERTYVPALGHAYGAYNDGVVTKAATATEDGVLSWTCSRCNKIGAEGVAVATNDYKGTIYAYDDMSNEEVTKYILKGFVYGDEEGREGETKRVSEDGNAYIHANTEGTYHEFFPAVPTTGFTASFDFCLNEIFDTGDTNNYGHIMHFWFGGLSGTGNLAGYDFETNQFFIRRDGADVYDPIVADFDLKPGVWYNISFKYFADYDSFEAWCALYVNGQEIVRFDSETNIDAGYELPYDDSRKTTTILYRSFGVNADYDNFVVGDLDFEWINYRTPANAEVIPGDLDGSGEVTAVDAALFKMYLIGAVSENEINIANADVNGDGKISARDSRALKIIISKGQR